MGAAFTACGTGNAQEAPNTVSANEAADHIAKLPDTDTEEQSVKVTGPITYRDIADIGDALRSNFKAKISLDLSGTTGLTTIGEMALDSCSSLTGIVIPDSVKALGPSSLSNTSLTSVTLGNGLTEICNSAFFNDIVTIYGNKDGWKKQDGTSVNAENLTEELRIGTALTK